MKDLITEEQYLKALKRLEQLFQINPDTLPYDDPLIAEFNEVEEIVREYENLHYPIKSNWYGNLNVWCFGVKCRFLKFYKKLRP